VGAGTGVGASVGVGGSGSCWNGTTCTKRLGVPDGTPFIAPYCAQPTSSSRTIAGRSNASFSVSDNPMSSFWAMPAATPATNGVAMEVPEIVLVAVSLPIQAERICDPGAKISTTGPKFEKLLLVSPCCVDPTVIAASAEAGE